MTRCHLIPLFKLRLLRSLCNTRFSFTTSYDQHAFVLGLSSRCHSHNPLPWPRGAHVAVTGLGVVIATSETLYGAIRVLGILFLLYLGYKKFRAKPFAIRLAHIENEEYADTPVENVNKKNLFIEGVLLQISNPALIIFYLSLFPQCIDKTLTYWPQVTILTLNYAVLVWIIHSMYGWLGSWAAGTLLKPSAAVWINRVAGVAYWLLGIAFLWQMFSNWHA